MVVTATEFQNNVGNFLQTVQDQDIVITRNGKEVARLISSKKAISFLTDSLVGALPLPQDFDVDNAKDEYFRDKYGANT